MANHSTGEIEPRVDAIGEVIGLSGPELLDDGTIKVHFRLQDGYDRAKVQPAYNGGPSKISRSIAEGVRVKVSNALPGLWRGELQLNLDADSEVNIADEDDSAAVVDVETRVSKSCSKMGLVSLPLLILQVLPKLLLSSNGRLQ